MGGHRSVAVLALGAAGCSAAFMRPPSTSVANPSCNTSAALPAIDTTLALASLAGGVYGLSRRDRAVAVGIPNTIDMFLFGLSARYGFRVVRQCRRARGEPEQPLVADVVPRWDLSCPELLPLLVSGSVMDAPPLEAQCDLEDARAALPGLSYREVRAMQGVGFTRTVLAVDGATAGSTVRIWFDLELVAMIEIDDPRLPGPWKSVQADLGLVPELTFGNQLAYASRGIAVILDDDGERVEKLLVFRPTTAEHYAWYYALPEPEPEPGPPPAPPALPDVWTLPL